MLLIEDDPVIGKSVKKGFNEAGHDCEWVTCAEKAQSLVRLQQVDVIVLDVMLPGQTGLELLRDFRSAGISTPAILLTALDSIEDRVGGLNSGADDYLGKPFAFAELLARVEALHRRSAASRPAASISAGDLSLDLTTRRVQRGGSEIELTPTEFSMLELLMRYAGQVVTRKMLCEHLWEVDWEGTTNVLEVHINRLRKKLERAGGEPLIHTIRGRGYALRPV